MAASEEYCLALLIGKDEGIESMATSSRLLVTNLVHSKGFTISLILLLGLFGYALAPSDLTPGNYSATVTLNLPDGVHTITQDFTLGSSAGQLKTTESIADPYTIRVSGRDQYAYRLGERITYQVEVTDNDGTPIVLPVEHASSIIRGPNYEQVLPPTDRASEALVFTMRVPFHARITTGLLFAVATIWLTEIVPLAAGALLIPVVIVVTGVTDTATVLQPFFHQIVVLFLAGFLMAEAMRRTGIDRLLALSILRRASTKPTYLMLSMMAITAFLSMWMSNTAAVAIIIPIALAILNKIPDSQAGGFHKALILGVAYAAAIGGIGSAIGTPANILAMTFLSEFVGVKLTFNDWFVYGLPLVVVMVPTIWIYLLLTFRVTARSELDRSVYIQELKELGPLNRSQKIIFAVFIVVVLLWLTENTHNIHASIIALAGALVLFFTEILHRDDLNRINWDALLTFGGGLSIGSLLVTTGVSDWIALQLIGLVNLPQIVVIFLIGVLTVAVGAFISNTACAAMLIPLAIPLARILQIDPRLLVVVVAIASSIDFALVVGTPPTMMAYSTGFFKTSEIFRRGIVLDFIGVALLTLGMIWVWRLFGAVSF